MEQVPLSKKDLLEALEGVAKATDLANVEDKMDALAERMNELPTRGELGELIAKTYDYATLKVEHDRMKHVIKEKLGVKV